MDCDSQLVSASEILKRLSNFESIQRSSTIGQKSQKSSKKTLAKAFTQISSPDSKKLIQGE